MNADNDYSVWRRDRDYCSDESEHSAEYKLGLQHHRLLEERGAANTIHKRQMPRPRIMNRTICMNPSFTEFEGDINRSSLQ